MRCDANRIRLVKLTKKIESSVLAIKTHDFQNNFYPSIRSSIELAKQYENAHLLAIEEHDVVCGFVLYGIDDDTKLWKLFRLVVDRNYQGQGIGGRTMVLICERLKTVHEAAELLLVVNEVNEIARGLYSKLGFTQYGRLEDKILMKLSFQEGI